MPAAPELVSLDHAKDWAKRLSKIRGEQSTLSQCQTEVAQMLGHANWHALTRFYAPTANTPLKPEEARDWDETQAALVDALNRRYPGLNVTSLEMMSSQEILDGEDIQLIMEKARELKNEEGYHWQDAMELALQKVAVPSFAPPNHLWVRMRDAKNQAFLIPIEKGLYSRLCRKS